MRPGRNSSGGRRPGWVSDWPEALLSFSSGKDSVLALQRARAEYQVTGLITTLSEPFNRVAMHGVREAILDAQAEALGLPVYKVALPYPCSNEEYERRLASALDPHRQAGVRHIIFGDLFLADIRAYRERQMAALGLTAVFPLWELPTGPLAEEMLEQGIESTLTCVDPRHLSREFAGRSFDRRLLDDLPGSVDPCGENGEFHTVVTAGPGFEQPLEVAVGEVVERDGFVFADVQLA